VIRNVVVGRLRPDADPGAVDAALAAIVGLDLPGRLDCRVGRDAGLRAGAWGFAITSDWADAESYRAYDLDPEHNRIRGELFGPLCEDIARVQFSA
jgi:hypothetical protein